MLRKLGAGSCRSNRLQPGDGNAAHVETAIRRQQLIAWAYRLWIVSHSIPERRFRRTISLADLRSAARGQQSRVCQRFAPQVVGRPMPRNKQPTQRGGKCNKKDSRSSLSTNRQAAPRVVLDQRVTLSGKTRSIPRFPETPLPLRSRNSRSNPSSMLLTKYRFHSRCRCINRNDFDHIVTTTRARRACQPDSGGAHIHAPADNPASYAVSGRRTSYPGTPVPGSSTLRRRARLTESQPLPGRPSELTSRALAERQLPRQDTCSAPKPRLNFRAV